MTGTGPRAAQAALDQARAAFERLDRAPGPEDGAAAVIEAWRSMELAMQAMAGTTALSGQPLLRELRQRNLLTLAEAHALIDGGTVAERMQAQTYTPSARDIDTVRAAFDELVRVLQRGGAAPSRAPAPASVAPADTATAAVPPATSRPSVFGRVVVVGAVLALLAGGGYGAYALTRESGDLRRGRTAYATGDRMTAQRAFEAAASQSPQLAEPHIYLGRMAREAGDLVTANDQLRRAVSLEPGNALAHRELASLLLLNQRPDLARAFYERAIRLNPEDKTALGYMGCTMVQLGRADLAQRFLTRAGNGPWNACVAVPPVPPAGLPPGAAVR